MSFELVFKDYLSKGEKEAIWDLLCLANDEFIPPLNCRKSTTDMTFSHSKEDKPISYFHALIRQKFILVKHGEELWGFLSFRNKYISDYLRIPKPSNYITTIYILESFRGRGITKMLYKFLEKNLPNEFFCDYISTRTWSTNQAHIHLLDGLNYSISSRIMNHRDKNIDTLYFSKKI